MSSSLGRAIPFVAGVAALATGAVAVFVTENASGAAALVAAGSVMVFLAVFGDRLLKGTIGGFEFELAQRVKDTLRSAFDQRIRGNYEGAEEEIRQAFDHFTEELSKEDKLTYRRSLEYQSVVTRHLEHIAKTFDGEVQTTTSSSSFLPLVDVVLRLRGPAVLDALLATNRPICADLEHHLHQDSLRVGATIRPGPDLDAKLLAIRLFNNVQQGALNATCFLLIQNCDDARSGDEFRRFARGLKMHATSVQWLSPGTEQQLRDALNDAILTICSEPSVA
jgi:hypothetical protein